MRFAKWPVRLLFVICFPFVMLAIGFHHGLENFADACECWWLDMAQEWESAEYISGKMDDIKRQFRPDAKITVAVRIPNEPEQDFILTDDDLNEVIIMIERRQRKEVKK